MPAYTNPAVPAASFQAPGDAARPEPAVPASRTRPADRPARTAGASPAKPRTAAGTAPARTFGALATRIEDVVADLEAMLAQLPAGRPDATDAKALRSAVGRLGAAAGAAKKRIPDLGIAGGR